MREESCPLEGDEEEEEEDFLLFRRTAFSRFSSCEELALPSPSLASSSSSLFQNRTGKKETRCLNTPLPWPSRSSPRSRLPSHRASWPLPAGF